MSSTIGKVSPLQNGVYRHGENWVLLTDNQIKILPSRSKARMKAKEYDLTTTTRGNLSAPDFIRAQRERGLPHKPVKMVDTTKPVPMQGESMEEAIDRAGIMVDGTAVQVPEIPSHRGSVSKWDTLPVNGRIVIPSDSTKKEKNRLYMSAYMHRRNHPDRFDFVVHKEEYSIQRVAVK